MLFVAVCSAIGFVSCGDDPDPYMSSSVTQLEISAAGETKTFSISSDCDWSISGMSGWLTVTPTNGNGENVTVTVSAGKNETTTERTCTLIISSSAGTKTIVVTQKGANGVLGISSTSLSFDKEAGSKTLTINANVDWSVSSNASWLHVNPQAGNSSTKTISVTVDKNETTESRSGDLLFSSSVGSQTVKVTQGAASVNIKVNGASSSELMFGSNANGNEPAQTVNITSNTGWTISNIPDWVRVSPTTGNGNATISITMVDENWSDEIRNATLKVSAGANSSASLVVKQDGSLAKNCRVTLSNKTIMCDGFAADLTFGKNVNAYYEVCMSEAARLSYSDREIFSILTSQEKTNGYLTSIDYTYSYVEAPNTAIYYFAVGVTAEGSFGPLYVDKVITKGITKEADMPFYISDGADYWNVTTIRDGEWGQKCDEYYLFYGKTETANRNLYKDLTTLPYAYTAHFYMKDILSESNYRYQPQTSYVGKNGSTYICCLTWGKNRDTKEFSSELQFDDYPRTVVSSKVRTVSKPHPLNWKDWRKSSISTRKEIEEMRKNLLVVKVKK